MRPSIVVRWSTRAEDLAALLCESPDGPLEGHGSRAMAIALDACHRARGIMVHDPSGFSRQVLATLFDNEELKDRAREDCTLSRSARSSQPWKLVVFKITDTNAEPGIGIAEDGEGRFFAFV